MSEPLVTASEVWLAVKEHISDEKQAGIDIVNALIDNLGFDGEAIKASELGQDQAIKSAVSAYLLDEEEEDDGLDTWGDEEDNEDLEEDY